MQGLRRAGAITINTACSSQAIRREERYCSTAMRAYVFRFPQSQGRAWHSLTYISWEFMPQLNPFRGWTSEPLNDFSLIGKDNWVSANFSLTLGTKKYSSGEFSGSGYVKGRGNLSWTQPQKPYSIKLEQKTSLLDIPATKRYAIVASYFGSLPDAQSCDIQSRCIAFGHGLCSRNANSLTFILTENTTEFISS